tara:strand:+ start:1784 stop:2074 length:291 start_codon:yes stop_codon:yes gene_type:complete
MSKEDWFIVVSAGILGCLFSVMFLEEAWLVGMKLVSLGYFKQWQVGYYLAMLPVMAASSLLGYMWGKLWATRFYKQNLDKVYLTAFSFPLKGENHE